MVSFWLPTFLVCMSEFYWLPLNAWKKIYNRLVFTIFMLCKLHIYHIYHWDPNVKWKYLKFPAIRKADTFFSRLVGLSINLPKHPSVCQKICLTPSSTCFCKQPKEKFSIFTMFDFVKQITSIKFCLRNEYSYADT